MTDAKRSDPFSNGAASARAADVPGGARIAPAREPTLGDDMPSTEDRASEDGASEISDTSESSEAVIQQAWKALLASWGEATAHETFVAVCESEGALKEAGRLYSDIRRRDASKAERAQEQLDALIRRAMARNALITPEKTSTPPTTPRFVQWVAYAFATALIVSSGWVIWSILGR